MARRQLKHRERYPSGQVKPDRSEPVTRIRAILAVASRRAPILGTPIGRLHFEGRLTVHEVAAAEHYANARAAHDRALGLPPPYPRSPVYDDDRGGGGEGDARADDKAIRRYRAMALAIGKPAVAILDRVTIQIEQPSWPEIAALKTALEAVSKYMQLSPVRR